MQTVVRDTQLVEQLVEVPTIVSFSSLQRIVEQNVDTPVSRRGLKVSRPGQGSSFSHSPGRVQERADEPGAGVFCTFHRVKKSAASAAVPSPSVPASVSSWTRAAYEAAEVAKREARSQEALRQAAEAIDRADKRRKKKKKRRMKKLPKTGRPWLPLRRVPAFEFLVPQNQFLLRVPVTPVATQILAPTVQTVQPTLSVQLHFLYGCYAPVVVRGRVSEMV